MNWVDIVLLVLVALSAVQGLRLGAAVQVLAYGGFWLGLFVGLELAPALIRHLHGQFSKTLVAAAVVLGCAALLGGLGRLAGSRSSALLHRLRLGPVDSAVGVVVGIAATLLAAWLVAPLMSNSSFPTLAAGFQESSIVRAVDSVLPSPQGLLSRIETYLSADGFPVVFAGLPPSLSPPVSVPPDTSPEVAAAVRDDGPSTVKIEGQGCGVIQEGSGFVVAPGLVVTNAHVVAGIASPQVIDYGGGHHGAVPIWFDPELDVAVLRVTGLHVPVLHLDDGPVVPRGSTGAVLGYPGGGPFTFVSAGVRTSFRASGLDIYGRHQTLRTVYELEATVRPGNSGGPLVYESATPGDPLDNTVVGVVFARSTVNGDVGYALATPAVAADVQQAERTDRAVSTEGCAP